jgi:hypothetical protein
MSSSPKFSRDLQKKLKLVLERDKKSAILINAIKIKLVLFNFYKIK